MRRARAAHRALDELYHQVRQDEHSERLSRRGGDRAAERQRSGRGEHGARDPSEMRDDRPEETADPWRGWSDEAAREQRAISVSESSEQRGAGRETSMPEKHRSGGESAERTTGCRKHRTSR